MIYFVTKNKDKHQVTYEEDVEHEDSLDKVIEYCKPLEVVGFDKETTGLDALTSKDLLIILGDAQCQFVIDSSSFTRDEIRNLFISIGLHKIYLGQNLKFDYKFLKVHYGIELFNVYDTMIAEQRLLQGRAVSFTLTSIVLRRIGVVPIEMQKEIRVEFVGANPENFIFKQYHITYAAGDIKYLFQIKEQQEIMIDKINLHFLLYEIEFPLIRILGNAELEGFKLNIDKWQEKIAVNKEKKFDYSAKLDADLRKLKQDLLTKEERVFLTGGRFDRERIKQADLMQMDLFGGFQEVDAKKKNEKVALINWASPDQLVTILGRLKQPAPTKKGDHIVPTFVEKRAKSGKVSYKVDTSLHKFTTGAGVIEGYLIENPNSPIKSLIKNLIQLRKANTRLNSFGQTFIDKCMNPVTGKIHTIFRQCDASTGRLQSGDKKRGWFNFQNIPAEKAYREAFETDEDYLIATTDLSGAEAVILIDKAHDEAFYDIAIVNDDAHSPLCQAVWRAIGKFRIEKMDADEFEDRSFSKEYAEATKLAQIVISKKENKDLRTSFKPMTFGSIYGLHDKKAAKTLNISKEEGKLSLNTIKRMIPKTFRMVESNAKFALANGYLILNKRTNSRIWYEKVFEAKKFNTKLNFMDEHDIDGSARNAPIQGTQADMVKEMMVEIDKEIVRQNIDAALLGQVHDELVYKFHKKHQSPTLEYINPEGELEFVDFPTLKKNIMCDVANRYLTYIKMTAEQHVGKTWTK